MIRWLWIALFVSIVGLLLALQLTDPGPRRGGVAPGSPAPPLALADTAGRPADLASRRGRVVVLNFWATWCEPCREELPDLVAAWRERAPCVDFLGVVADSPRADVDKAAASMPWPVLVDEGGQAPRDWRVKAFPHTYVVDAQGIVRASLEGAVGREQLAAALAPVLPASCAGAARAP